MSIGYFNLFSILLQRNAFKLLKNVSVQFLQRDNHTFNELMTHIQLLHKETNQHLRTKDQLTSLQTYNIIIYK